MDKAEVTIDVKNLKEIEKKLEGFTGDAEKVLRRTTSDFKTRAPGWISTAVTEEYNIKKSDVKSAYKGSKVKGTVKVSGASMDDVALEYSGKRLTPAHFKMKPKKPRNTRLKKEKQVIPGQNIAGFNGRFATVSPQKPYQITVEILKGHPETLHGKPNYSTPFLASNGAGLNLPFQRKSSKRTDMKSVRTISVPQMITNETVAENIQEKIKDGLSKRLDHHLEQMAKK